MINKRVLKIVEVLLEQESYITIDKISEQLSVSNKTIRNDLLLVDEWLTDNQLHLIKKTGIGVCIEGSHSQKLRILENVRKKNTSVVEHSPAARQTFIGMQLASYDNCRIYELSEQLYVSRATIHKDLLSLSKSMELFGIQLHRKNNNGISIEGKEKNIRNFLLKLMLEDNGYQLFIDIVQNASYHCTGTLVFAGLEATDDEIKDFVHCILRAHNSYIKALDFHSIIIILLRIYAAYLRIQEHHIITLSDEFIQELNSEPFFKEAQEITDRLANHYRIQIPTVETHYLQLYFLSMQGTQLTNEKDQKEARELCDQLLTSWSEQLGVPFMKDEELKKSIYAHLCPSITRFRHNIPNENPLMPEIHDLYKHTLAVVKNSIHCIEERFHCTVSDDEISYLALHLAASLERLKKPLRTILVTHEGTAAAAILKQKLIHQINEIDIVDQESFLSIHHCDLTGIDLIISTIEISLKTDIPILLINPLLHNYDILRLKDAVKEYYNQKNDPIRRKTALSQQ